MQMQKSCPDYADALVDFSDGELPPAERTMVEEHLAVCPACRAELMRLDASLLRLSEGISAEPVSVRGRGAMSPRLGWAAAVAAAVLLCVGATWWSSWRRTDQSLVAKLPSPAVEIGSMRKL